MITKEDIEVERSPKGLRQFVTRRMHKIRKNKTERHKGMTKRGIYKVFVDEIIPLSIFCLKMYPNTYKVLPVLGNQGYDAVIKDDRGQVFEYLELTAPHNGEKAAEEAKQLVSKGCVCLPMVDYNQAGFLKGMLPVIIETCRKKSQKDYSECSLVIVIDFFPPFNEEYKTGTDLFNLKYSAKIAEPKGGEDAK